MHGVAVGRTVLRDAVLAAARRPCATAGRKECMVDGGMLGFNRKSMSTAMSKKMHQRRNVRASCVTSSSTTTPSTKLSFSPLQSRKTIKECDKMRVFACLQTVNQEPTLFYSSVEPWPRRPNDAEQSSEAVDASATFSFVYSSALQPQ
jgi:hypothetical protein